MNTKIKFRITILGTVLCVASCSTPCPPSSDPYLANATPIKPSAKDIAGVYNDFWNKWPGFYRQTWEFHQNGTGQYSQVIEWVDQEPFISATAMHWSQQPDGLINVNFAPSPASYCNGGNYTMRMTKNGLHNLTTGRLLPRYGSGIQQTKLRQGMAKFGTHRAIDGAVEGVLGSVILGAGTAMIANQSASGISGGNAAAAQAVAGGAGSGGLGVWTALGKGTWLYNDGSMTGTVNSQGYFYGTNSKTGKVTLRNPNTFTPGVGTLH